MLTFGNRQKTMLTVGNRQKTILTVGNRQKTILTGGSGQKTILTVGKRQKTMLTVIIVVSYLGLVNASRRNPLENQDLLYCNFMRTFSENFSLSLHL